MTKTGMPTPRPMARACELEALAFVVTAAVDSAPAIGIVVVEEIEEERTFAEVVAGNLEDVMGAASIADE